MVEHSIEEKWVLDSGCSFHMCPNEDWFTELEHQEGGTVLLGNDQACAVKGGGSIKHRLHDGSLRLLQEVRYIPPLRRNLISLGSLERK